MKKLDYRGAVIPLILFGLWSWVTAKQWIDPALLPLPKQVWLAFLDGLQSGELYENVIASLLRNTTGFIVGGVIGAGLGLTILSLS